MKYLNIFQTRFINDILRFLQILLKDSKLFLDFIKLEAEIKIKKLRREWIDLSIIVRS